MSVTETIFAPAPLFAAPRRLFESFAAWRREFARYRETMNELNKLDDRDLADLGMSRADFHYLAKSAAARG